MENVVPIEQLAAFVERSLNEMRIGVYNARQSGLFCELPSKVDFQVVVIAPAGWQALDLQKGQNGTTVEEQGGGSSEFTSGGEKSTQTRTSRTDGANNNAHNETSTRSVTYTG